MGNEGSKTGRGDNSSEQEPRGKLSPPVAKCSPLRSDPIIGVDSNARNGNTTHLDYSQVKGVAKPMAIGKHGKLPGGGDPTSPNLPVDTKGAQGNVPFVKTGRNPPVSGSLLGLDGRGNGVETCGKPSMDRGMGISYNGGLRSRADPRTAQSDAATDVTVDNTSRKYGSSTLYAARSKFDARNNDSERNTVAYQAIVSCADIKLVDNSNSKDQSPKTRCFVFGKSDMDRCSWSDPSEINVQDTLKDHTSIEGQDHRVCKPRQLGTQNRHSPDGESVKLDLSPNEENAKFIHVSEEGLASRLIAEESGDRMDSVDQKDDHRVVDDVDIITGHPVDIAGSPLQYEDCVEYIESGHSGHLTDLRRMAPGRPETVGGELLVERSTDKEAVTVESREADEVKSERKIDETLAVSIYLKSNS